MGWVSSWTSYWLAIPSVFAPLSIPAFLVDRMNFGEKVLWVDWCPYHSTGVPDWLQEVASSGFMTILAKVTCTDSWESALSQVFVTLRGDSLPSLT